MEVESGEVVGCEFYFSDQKKSKIRPVIVFKDNLPFNDFIGIPISSQIDNLKKDEFVINNKDFENGELPKDSKVIIRKPFAISKTIVNKKYGKLNHETFQKVTKEFCNYFGCDER